MTPYSGAGDLTFTINTTSFSTDLQSAIFLVKMTLQIKANSTSGRINDYPKAYIAWLSMEYNFYYAI